MSQEMIINMKSSVIIIYEMKVALRNILQTIIVGVRCFTFMLFNSIWEFTEAFDNNDFASSPTDSPRKQLIDNSWCNIDPNNIINNDKKRK